MQRRCAEAASPGMAHLVDLLLGARLADRLHQVLLGDDPVRVAVEHGEGGAQRGLADDLLGRAGGGEEGVVLDLALVIHVDRLEQAAHLHLGDLGVVLHGLLELLVRDGAGVVRVDGLEELAELVEARRRGGEGHYLERHLVHGLRVHEVLQRVQHERVTLHLLRRRGRVGAASTHLLDPGVIEGLLSGGARPRIPVQQRANEVLRGGRDVVPRLVLEGSLALLDEPPLLLAVGVVKGPPPAQQHISHHAEAPHVAGRGVALQPALPTAGEHFGRHVGERACR